LQQRLDLFGPGEVTRLMAALELLLTPEPLSGKNSQRRRLTVRPAISSSLVDEHLAGPGRTK
jgi:hypothetical protein